MQNEGLSTLAVFTILDIKRPVSGELYGHQMVLATPNEARYDAASNCYVQSFAQKYRVAESGIMPMALLTQDFIDRWVEKQAKWHKVRIR